MPIRDAGHHNNIRGLRHGNRYHPACYRIQFGELPDERPKGTAKGVYVDEKKLGGKKR